MNRKEELIKLKNFFKKKGVGYDDLEEKLSYGKGTLRSGIARGGTDKMLVSLKNLKIELFPEEVEEENLVMESHSSFGSKTYGSDYIELQGKLIIAQSELLKLKDENITLLKENDELKEELRKYKPVNVESPTYTLPGENQLREAAS